MNVVPVLDRMLNRVGTRFAVAAMRIAFIT